MQLSAKRVLFCTTHLFINGVINGYELTESSRSPAGGIVSYQIDSTSAHSIKPLSSEATSQAATRDFIYQLHNELRGPQTLHESLEADADTRHRSVGVGTMGTTVLALQNSVVREGDLGHTPTLKAKGGSETTDTDSNDAVKVSAGQAGSSLPVTGKVNFFVDIDPVVTAGHPISAALQVTGKHGSILSSFDGLIFFALERISEKGSLVPPEAIDSSVFTGSTSVKANKGNKIFIIK